MAPTVDRSDTRPIPTRRLGRTNEMVSMVGLGGYHLGLLPTAESSVRLVHKALDRGITFLDNSWDYHDGESERRMGRALKESQHRDRAFLMTKIDGRTAKSAVDQLEDSLRRLKTDRIDLLQFHEIIRFEDADRIVREGALDAMQKARKAGKIRYLGFTGHKDPAVHLYMLEVATRNGFTFDAVQMPLNVFDAHFRSFEQRVLPELVRQDIGVIGMKSLCAGKALKVVGLSALDCLRYAMNLPTSVVVTGIDKHALLDQAVEAAVGFAPMEAAAVKKLLDRSAKAAMEGKYESFKTTSEHDATARHPEWLGKDARA